MMSKEDNSAVTIDWEDESMKHSDEISCVMACENENGYYEVSSKLELENIWELKDLVLVPLLLSMGYRPATLEKLFGDNKQEEPVAEDDWEKANHIKIGTRFIANSFASNAPVGSMWQLTEGRQSRHGIKCELLCLETTGGYVQGNSYNGTWYIQDVTNITQDELDFIFDNDYHRFSELADR